MFLSSVRNPFKLPNTFLSIVRNPFRPPNTFLSSVRNPFRLLNTFLSSIRNPFRLPNMFLTSVRKLFRLTDTVATSVRRLIGGIGVRLHFFDKSSTNHFSGQSVLFLEGDNCPKMCFLIRHTRQCPGIGWTYHQFRDILFYVYNVGHAFPKRLPLCWSSALILRLCSKYRLTKMIPFRQRVVDCQIVFHRHQSED